MKHNFEKLYAVYYQESRYLKAFDCFIENTFNNIDEILYKMLKYCLNCGLNRFMNHQIYYNSNIDELIDWKTYKSNVSYIVQNTDKSIEKLK